MLALKEAEKASKNGDVPVGAVIVKDNTVIAKAFNMKEQNQNAIEHAEILAINIACKKMKSWRLDECTMYVTMEPCLMCAGAILQSRIKKLVYGTSNERFGYVGSIDNVLNNDLNNHKVIIEKEILDEECSKIVKEFFKNTRREKS